MSFNQDMIAPEVLDADFYESVFELSIISAVDGSQYYGDYSKSSQGRKLKGSKGGSSFNSFDAGDNAEDLGFVYIVEEHNPTIIDIQIQFENPNEISSSPWGQDTIIVDILELSVFKSALTGTEMDTSMLEKDAVVKSIPPLIIDIDQVRQLETST